MCIFVLDASPLSAQTWQPHSLVSQYYPNNDVKSHGGKLWVASNDGLYTSTDNGATWTEATTSFSNNSDLVEIQFTNNGDVFVRKNSFGVIRSFDGGSTWEMDTAGVGSNYTTDVLYYDSVTDKVFLGIGYPKYKLYYQAPNDASWTPVTGVPSSVNSFSPVQMTRKGSKLFIIDVYMRVLESSDNGMTWIQKSGTGLTDAGSQVGPSRFLSIGNDLFLGVGGVWKSSDDGNTWARVDQGFASADVRCLYYDGTALHASVYSQRKTYRSTDNGTTWTEFGGSGSWFFKAMAKHNNALYGVIHAKDSLYVLGGSSTGITEAADWKFGLYPNPAKEKVFLTDLDAGVTVTVLELSGKEIKREYIVNQVHELDITALSNGIYIVRILSQGMYASRKLIVNR